MSYSKPPDRREWREVTLDELGLSTATIPDSYLVPALKRIAFILCGLPSMKLEDLRREVIRGSADINFDVAETALASHIGAGRITVMSSTFSIRVRNSDGDDETDDEQLHVFATPALSTWWNSIEAGGQSIPTIEAMRDQSTEDRDHWIYEQCCKGTHYTGIRGELNKLASPNGWDFIDSVQGIREAAKRYARRHNLALPPPRKRPGKRN